MKIRHRQSGVELEGEFVECGEGGPCIPSRSYFSDIHSGSLYDKVCWEAVPEWVDVTGECVVYEEEAISHGNSIKFVPHAATCNYRLRKVRFSTGIPPFSGERWAFIVERKV